MRALFLLLALLLAGCGSEVRTHPVGGPPPIPRLTAPPEDSIMTAGRALSGADFSQSSPDSLTWRKGTPHGGVIVTLSRRNGVSATAQYNRIDGNATCEIPGPGVVLVSRIEDLDAIPTAAKLIAEHGCMPA